MNTPPPFAEPTHFGDGSDLPEVPEHLLKFPAEIKTFGILHWVVAFFGFICFAGGSTVIIFFSYLVNQIPPQIPPEEREVFLRIASFAESIAWIMWIQLASSCLLTLLLCVAGFGLLKARAYGRTLSLFYAALSIFTKIYLAALAIIYIAPELQKFTASLQELVQEKDQSPMGEEMGLLNTVINTLLFCVYPILVLIFMNRKQVRDCLRGR
jgi:hypothetical protein